MWAEADSQASLLLMTLGTATAAVFVSTLQGPQCMCEDGRPLLAFPQAVPTYLYAQLHTLYVTGAVAKAVRRTRQRRRDLAREACAQGRGAR